MKKRIEFHFKGGIADNGQLPVDEMMDMLQNIQGLVYLLAAQEKGITFNQRFRPSREIKNEYRINCEIPKEGSYAQAVVIESPERELPLFGNSSISVGEKVNNIYETLSSPNNNLSQIITSYFPNIRERQRALSYVRDSLPKSDSSIFVMVNDNIDSRNLQKNVTILIDQSRQIAEEFMTTVTGHLEAIDFSKKIITIFYPPNKRSLDCYYTEEVEEMLCENRRMLVQITGKVKLDEQDIPKEITDVIDIQGIDLSPIDLDIFSYGNKRLKFRITKSVAPTLDEDQQLYIFIAKELGIDVFAYNRKELLEAISEQIEFLWDTYAKEDESNLTKQANLIRENLLKEIEELSDAER